MRKRPRLVEPVEAVSDEGWSAEDLIEQFLARGAPEQAPSDLGPVQQIVFALLHRLNSDFPLAWLAVLSEYRDRGQPLDLTRLKEIVLYWGATTPGEPAAIAGKAGASSIPTWTRTDFLLKYVGRGALELLTDLYAFVQTIPERDRDRYREALADLLLRAGLWRGLELRGIAARHNGTLTIPSEGPGRPRHVVHEIVRQLANYLEPHFLAGWKKHDPATLRRHVALFLRPTFGDVRDAVIRAALRKHPK